MLIFSSSQNTGLKLKAIFYKSLDLNNGAFATKTRNYWFLRYVVSVECRGCYGWPGDFGSNKVIKEQIKTKMLSKLQKKGILMDIIIFSHFLTANTVITII